tara:strand:+ start:268 stop:1491 length:1224 start_codon:yes stop_codon:yes gene_type:complete
MAEPAATWTPLASLTPWEQNPRDNTEAIAEVAKSIRRFGFGAPIVANSRDSTIIAGHTRLEAAKRLGLEEVPVRWMDLDPVDAKALALADNKVGEIATWDDAMLAQVLADLAAVDESVLADTGFSDEELSELMADVDGAEDVEDPGPGEPPEEPVSQVGEIYALGPHRLVCGDCTDPDLVARLLGGVKIDVLYADPPYGMNLDTNYGDMHSGKGQDYRKNPTVNRFDPVAGDDAPYDPSAVFQLWPAPEQFWWGADYYRAGLPNGGSWVVWDKRDNKQGMNLDAVLGSMFELCWSKISHRRHIARVLWCGHWGMGPTGHGGDPAVRIHPTQKPAALARWFFDKWAPDGCVVADPYLGSGTTLIAAAQTGRVCYGAELSPAYCDVIRRRWTKWAVEAGQDPGSGALDG